MRPPVPAPAQSEQIFVVGLQVKPFVQLAHVIPPVPHCAFVFPG
jgi:hypothetical protein